MKVFKKATSFLKKYLIQLYLYIKRPLTLFDTWAAKERFNWMPDKLYLSLMFRSKMGYWMNWKEPKTFNEKLQWLKIYDRKPLYTKLVDKYEVRDYIAKKIGKEYLVPLLGVWDNPDDIDFCNLPNQFVIKCTHDSASVIICKDKESFDIDAAKEKLRHHMSKNYYYFSREWPYKNITPKIIAEKNLNEKADDLKDYKFFCFNGIVQYIQVDYNRFVDHRRNIYSPQWEPQDFSIQYPSGKEISISKPQNLDKMIEIAQTLSQEAPHIRIDLYNINGKIFFGECTFYHGAGFEKFSPPEWDLKFGSLIKIKKT